IDPPDSDSGKESACDEVSGELVVAGGDAAKVLEAAEHALDQVALAIDALVVGEERFAPANRGDDGLDGLVGEHGAQWIGVVGLVADQSGNPPGRLDESWRVDDVVGIAGAERKNSRPPLGVGQGGGFYRAPTSRSADRMLVRPRFPTPAERCSLIVELSIATVAVIPVDPVSV